MKTEHLLYGLAAGETHSYMETLLLCTTQPELIEVCKHKAANDGFHSFRVTTFNGGKPDFASTCNQ